jgi:nucleoid-associated protein EbfC
MNQAQMLAQVRKLQADMAKAQEELASTVVQGSAANGLVTVDVTCDQRVKAIKISKDAVDPDDIETLEDIVTIAVNDALKKASETAAQRMGGLTGGIKIPGLM